MLLHAERFDVSTRWQSWVMTRIDLDQIVHRLAARQYGLITRTQALELGYTSAMIVGRLRSRRWVRVVAGVYRLAGTTVSWHQRAMAACLDAGLPVAVSHRSAAVLLGASGVRQGPIEISVPESRRGPSGVARVHRVRALERSDITRVAGISVTKPARTLIDVASVVSPAVLEEVVDDFLCRRLVSLDRLERRVSDLGGRGKVGIGVLRTILAAWTTGPLPATVAEMRVIRCLLSRGLPQPARQHEIFRRGKLLARVDLAYPEASLAIELDSFRWHGGRRPFDSDRARRNRVEGAGWHVLQATPDAIESGGSDLCAAVEQLRRRRAA